MEPSFNRLAYPALLTWLKRRGLHGVERRVADAHVGLVQATQRASQGVLWQCARSTARAMYGCSFLSRLRV